MSKIAYCEAGCMDGILVSSEELEEFAHKLGNDFIDLVMPLPGISLKEQNKKLKNCTHEEEEFESQEAHYWEIEGRSHGWCCAKCGKVTQWG